MSATNGSPKPNTKPPKKREVKPDAAPVPMPWMDDKHVRVVMLATGAPVADDFREKAIDYIDVAPKPVNVHVPLVDYFERVKRHKADKWQRDFCERLQHAFEHRHERPTRAMVHAEAQLGKSSLMVQCFSAWILGHDPWHRIALATYNVTRSQSHSAAVIAIMNLPIHREIFPKRESHVPLRTSSARWRTNARREDLSTDAQDSFNPVGLQSGLTGSGFDTLFIDDPYADQKEAFSETVRANLQAFWEYTVMSRLGEYSNVFGMFHRYHFEDMAGYLLDKGTFEYWRYATICDGPYIHETTGQRFEDPLKREIGEYISERRGPSYYAEKRGNKRVWYSMFQGRPSAEEGEFFNVGKIKHISAAEAADRRAKASVLVRAWDLAATEADGDFSTAPLLSMTSDLRATIHHAVHKQVDTAGRDALQDQTAANDGAGVVITVPQDPGAAGKSLVYYTQQRLKDFTVAVRATSGSKEDRARNLASAVNSGMVEFAPDDHLPEDERWVKDAKTELRNFPLSEHNDFVDSMADAYNEAFERITKGLVIKNYRPHANLLAWHVFAEAFRVNGTAAFKIPPHWTVYVGVKITPDASTPNSAVIVARAPDDTRLVDTLFAVAEYKAFTDDVNAMFTWIDLALKCYCAGNAEDVTIWLHPDSEEYKHTIWQKLERSVAIFDGGDTAGLSELDWYLGARGEVGGIFGTVPSGFYALIADPAQISVPTNEYGFYSLRQEFATWAFNDKGEPNAIGSVLDCLRMIAYNFRTVPAPLTKQQEIEERLGVAVRAETIAAITDPAERDRRLQRRMLDITSVAKEVEGPQRTGRTRGPMSRR